MTIGERIKNLRIDRKLTQTQVANAINSTKQTIYKYESDIVTNIPMEKIRQLSDVFGVTPSYIMGWDINKPLVNGDEELTEYLEILKNRSECRMLFSLAKDATKEDVEKAVKIIEALRSIER